MAYEPLHHKYRPQTFADLVGQSAIATTLANALTSQRIAPAYLFAGPRGTGKTSSARILAKSLNCLAHDGPTPTPCGTCEVCTAIARGSALDVIEIDAASNTGVDNIREIIERSQFAPVQCRYKVYVIDECHMLSVAAFNALLKTLEEPPERVVFVLATTDPQRVLPTIISRCQRFDYRRIPLEAMTNHLQYIAQQETIDIAPEALALVAQMANGGLRDAESLLDQLSLLAETITPERVWDLVGTVPEQSLLTLVEAIAADQAVSVMTQCREMLDRGREPLIVLQNLTSFLVSLLMAKTAPNRPDLAMVTAQTWPQLCEAAQQWSLPQILQAQQHLKESEVQIKNSTQPRLWLEVTLMGLLPSRLQVMPVTTSAVPTIPVAQTQTVQKTIPPPSSVPAPAPSVSTPVASKAAEVKKEEAIAPPPSLVQTTATATPAASPTITPKETSPQPVASQNPEPASNQATESITLSVPEDLTQIWQQVIQQLPPINKALFNSHGELCQLTPTATLVGISSEPLLKVAQSKIPQLEAAFAAVCQRSIKVNLQIISKSETKVAAPSPAPPIPSSVPPEQPKQPPVETTANPAAFAGAVTQETKFVSVQEQPRRSQPAMQSVASNPGIAPTNGATSEEQASLAAQTSPQANAVNGTSSQKAAEKLAQFFEGEVLSTADSLLPENVAEGSPTASPSQNGSERSPQVPSPHEPAVSIQGRPDVSQLSEDDDVPF